MAGAVVEAVDAFCTARTKPSSAPVVAAVKKPDDSAKKPEHAAKKPDDTPKKPNEAARQRAAAESGTWSFLRNLKLLSSAHVRNREPAEK